MSVLIDKADFTAHIYRMLQSHGSLAEQEIDGMRMVQMLGGLLTETLLLFEEPELGLEASYAKLSDLLGCEPFDGYVDNSAIPPSYIVDNVTEQGRAIARVLFEDWLECAYEFHDLVLFVTQNMIIKLEQEGHPRAEIFRLFIECTNLCMGYEIAAQELCEIVIERKIAPGIWNLPESISGLSALSGRCLALSHNACELFAKPSLPEKLDQVAYVMMQEAVRLGIPAGSDWRFGLAANDCAHSAPYELIETLEPECRGFFKAAGMNDLLDQSVAFAKAAGRMVALSASGEAPDIEPVLAKPLAMAAMTDTYKSVCYTQAAAL